MLRHILHNYTIISRINHCKRAYAIYKDYILILYWYGRYYNTWLILYNIQINIF